MPPFLPNLLFVSLNSGSVRCPVISDGEARSSAAGRDGGTRGGGIRREGKNQIFSIIDKLQGRDYFIYPEPGRRGFQGKGGIKGLMAAPGSTDLRSKASASLLFS